MEQNLYIFICIPINIYIYIYIPLAFQQGLRMFMIIRNIFTVSL
jgi:hypothetical protein